MLVRSLAASVLRAWKLTSSPRADVRSLGPGRGCWPSWHLSGTLQLQKNDRFFRSQLVAHRVKAKNSQETLVKILVSVLRWACELSRQVEIDQLASIRSEWTKEETHAVT